MIENSVTLEFSKSLISLAGYDFGKSIYNDQIKDKLDFSVEFEIIFPDRIEFIASSFIQGLFSEIVSKIGLLSTENRLIVKCGTESLEKSVKSKLF